jgi:polysaccharide export outer membrane protein
MMYFWLNSLTQTGSNNMRFLLSACFVFCLFFASSCAYKQDQILFQEKTSIDSARQKNVETLAGYKIQPQDILQVRNLQNISFIVGDAGGGSSSGSGGGGSSSGGGQTYQVEEDGTVALPVIGRVPVAGLTRMEASKQIEDLYRKTLLKDPIIEVKIVNLKVTILGEIRSQGNYPLVKDKTTLVEMIGEAGGLTDRANEKNVEIIRGGPDNSRITVINLRDVSAITDPATILHNGDIIYIAENKRAIRADKVINLSTFIQPVLIILSTVVIIYSLAHR